MGDTCEEPLGHVTVICTDAARRNYPLSSMVRRFGDRVTGSGPPARSNRPSLGSE
jgi:hypothetical protein